MQLDSQRLVRSSRGQVLPAVSSSQREQLCRDERVNALQQRSLPIGENQHSTSLQSNILGSSVNQVLSKLKGSRGPVAFKSDAGGDSKALMDAGGSLHCAFCEWTVVGDAIDCAGCSGRFHAGVALVGVDEVISCLLQVKSGALHYLCCQFRVSIKSKSNFPAVKSDSPLKQLLKIAGTLSARVRN